jgi:hypothetical protein
MKTQKLNSLTAPQATPVIQKLLKLGYIGFKRQAVSGSNDVINVIRNPKNNFTVEFCTKKSVKGKDYVNWAKVYGPADAVDRFLVAVGYAPAPVKEVKTIQTTFDF